MVLDEYLFNGTHVETEFFLSDVRRTKCKVLHAEWSHGDTRGERQGSVTALASLTADSLKRYYT